ncbi:D-alanyl-D-alanine carboxypeptidase family protein [Paenibacillus sp. CAU 1782]
MIGMSDKLQMLERREKKRRNALKMTAILAVIAAVCLGFQSVKGLSPEAGVQLEAAAAILIDVESGEVLYQHNADKPLPPASMSKMMTELVVLDQIYSGELRWNDEVYASAYAGAIPGSRMGLAEGDKVLVRELFEAMTIYSANDAAVALAEKIGGTEDGFVAKMNERADRIGLSSTAVFGNASGLSKTDIAGIPGSASTRDTMLSARDTAKLAGHLIGRYPEVLEVSSRSSVKVSTSKRALGATNWMLADQPYAYPGSDGLKTGYTPNAGYCFTGTVKQGEQRLISVVMGTDSKEARFAETAKLYQLGFGRQGSRSV